MKKLLTLGFWFLVIGISWLVFLPGKAKAIYSCNEVGISISVDPGIVRQENIFTVTFDPALAAGKINLDREKGICLSCLLADDCLSIGVPSASDYQLSFTMAGDKCSVRELGNHYIVIKDAAGGAECKQDNAYTISYPSCQSSVYPTVIPLGSQTVRIKFFGWGNFVNDASLVLVKDGQALLGGLGRGRDGNDLVIDLTRNFEETGWYWVLLKITGALGKVEASCESKSFQVVGVGVTPIPSPTGAPGFPIDLQGPCPKDNIWTGLGCIPTGNTTNFIAWLLKFAIGIGGGIAFLLMLFGAFQLMTSSGDPERVQAGKQLITSALAGLLMIIFSVFLLELIGVDILQIPGL